MFTFTFSDLYLNHSTQHDKRAKRKMLGCTQGPIPNKSAPPPPVPRKAVLRSASNADPQPQFNENIPSGKDRRVSFFSWKWAVN